MSDVPSWSEAIEQWAPRLLRRPSTVRTYCVYIRRLAAAAAADGLGLEDVTAAWLGKWVAGRSWSKWTRLGFLSAARAFYTYAIDRGWCDKSPALGVAAQFQANRRRDVAWYTAIEEFLTSLRAGGRSSGTVKIRRNHLCNLAELYADPWRVTGDDLTAWLARPEITPEYRRALRSSAQLFYRWAARTGRTTHNPAAFLNPVQCPRALPRPITSDALTTALSRADDRQRLILLLAAVAGLRRAEIASASFADLLGDDDQLLIRGKGGHHRIVPLHPDLVRELRVERDRRRLGQHGTGWGSSSGSNLPDGYLFPGREVIRGELRPMSESTIAKIARRCLPQGWTLHTLRHRFATRAYAAQRDLRAVQELLGHTKPETTARYAAVPDGAKLAAVLGAGL